MMAGSQAKLHSWSAPTSVATSPDVSPVRGTSMSVLLTALQAQIEFYFSPQNLSSDKYLQSHMNEQQYVPIAVIADFKMVKKLTTDIELVGEAISRSKVLEMEPTEGLVRGKGKTERTTLILRDIPADTPVDDLIALFANDNCAAITSIRPDIGETWFVSFETEEECLRTAMYIRQQSFRGKLIRLRVKSENLLRSFYNHQAMPGPNGQPFFNPSMMYAAGCNGGSRIVPGQGEQMLQRNPAARRGAAGFYEAEAGGSGFPLHKQANQSKAPIGVRDGNNSNRRYTERPAGSHEPREQRRKFMSGPGRKARSDAQTIGNLQREGGNVDASPLTYGSNPAQTQATNAGQQFGPGSKGRKTNKPRNPAHMLKRTDDVSNVPAGVQGTSSPPGNSSGAGARNGKNNSPTAAAERPSTKSTAHVDGPVPQPELGLEHFPALPSVAKSDSTIVSASNAVAPAREVAQIADPVCQVFPASEDLSDPFAALFSADPAPVAAPTVEEICPVETSESLSSLPCSGGDVACVSASLQIESESAEKCIDAATVDVKCVDQDSFELSVVDVKQCQLSSVAAAVVVPKIISYASMARRVIANSAPISTVPAAINATTKSS